MFAIYSQRSPTAALCIFPIVIAAALAYRAIVASRKRVLLSPERRDRLNKIVVYASAFEGVAIFVGINVLRNLGIADQTLPLLAVIVGLHFLPFARYLPDWRYYWVAFTLVTIGVVGAVIGSPDLRGGFVGVSSALVLWSAAVVASRERRDQGPDLASR